MTEIELNQESQETLQISVETETAALAVTVGVVEPDLVPSGVLNNIRIIPGEQETAEPAPFPGEITVVIHEPVVPGAPKRKVRANPLVYEARSLLTDWGWLPVRLCEPTLPINLIAMKGPDTILILVLRSRSPVPSGAVLYELFPGLVRELMAFAGKIQHRIMIWVYSPECGWRYYYVDLGGLVNDPDFPKSFEKK